MVGEIAREVGQRVGTGRSRPVVRSGAAWAHVRGGHSRGRARDAPMSDDVSREVGRGMGPRPGRSLARSGEACAHVRGGLSRGWGRHAPMSGEVSREVGRGMRPCPGRCWAKYTTHQPIELPRALGWHATL